MDNLHVTLTPRPKLTVRIEKEYIKPLLQDLTVTPTGDVQVFTPEAPYNGFETVTVDAAEQVFYTTSGVPYPQHLEFPDTMTKLKAWSDCTELLSVKFPEHLEDVDVASCFANCTKLESAVLPKSVDGLRLGTRFFQYCKALKNVELPLGIIGLSTNDFDGCTSLESLTIPNEGNFTYISTNVFKNCTSLKTINIPASVTLMQDSAFYNCTNLEHVTLEQGYCKSLNLSASNKFSADTIVAMFNALADLTGSDTQTLNLGAKNLAKVTEEQKQIATNKNWNLA